MHSALFMNFPKIFVPFSIIYPQLCKSLCGSNDNRIMKYQKTINNLFFLFFFLNQNGSSNSQGCRPEAVVYVIHAAVLD